MAVYIANFGYQNWLWAECLNRGTIASMNEVESFALWEKGDREGYIQNRLKTKTAAGITPTVPVASRWFNLMTIISKSMDDIWLHRDTEYIWWTTSLNEPPKYERRKEPVGRLRELVICHKPCTAWKRESIQGNALPWSGLHPKAKDFLSTEATLQKLSPANSEYVLALIYGTPLSKWYELPEWKNKIAASKSKAGAGVVYNDEQKAIYRMAETAFQTSEYSNGQEVRRTVKNKDMKFNSKEELHQYIAALLRDQEKTCALTELQLNMLEKEGDPQLRASLDRIDSNGHYEVGNLQVVCKFANKWKSDFDNTEFLRLMSIVKSS
jgi:hypothetical protein